MVGRLTIYFKQKNCFFHMIFGRTSIVLAVRFEVVRDRNLNLKFDWFSNVMKSTTLESSLSGMHFVYFSRPLTSESMKISLILNIIAT